jgi:hypothetical protein
VLANMRVLSSLVMTRPSRAGDGAAESMLVVACLGAATDRQGVPVDRPSAASDGQGATINHPGAASNAASDYQGATTDERC